jgi:hypothetical protein
MRSHRYSRRAAGDGDIGRGEGSGSDRAARGVTGRCELVYRALKPGDVRGGHAGGVVQDALEASDEAATGGLAGDYQRGLYAAGSGVREAETAQPVARTSSWTTGKLRDTSWCRRRDRPGRSRGPKCTGTDTPRGSGTRRSDE